MITVNVTSQTQEYWDLKESLSAELKELHDEFYAE